MPAEIQHGVQCRDGNLGVRPAVLLPGRPRRCLREACRPRWREGNTRVEGGEEPHQDLRVLELQGRDWAMGKKTPLREG